jgi:glycyl-tRNA synthetase alpha chain
VTERTGYIARVRGLARRTALAYVESREKLGFPLLRAAASAEEPA